MYSFLQEHKVSALYLPLVLYWILIFILTSIPTGTFPDIVAVQDKIKHFGAYSVLTILLSLTLHFQQRLKGVSIRYIFFTSVIVLVYSTIDELHQILIPGRSAEILDWLANLFGLIFGLFITKKVIIKDRDQIPRNEYGNQKI